MTDTGVNAGAGWGPAPVEEEPDRRDRLNAREPARLIGPESLRDVGGTAPVLAPDRPREQPVRPEAGGGMRSRIGEAAARAHTHIRRRLIVDVGMLALGAVIAGVYDGNVSRGGLPWAALFVTLTFAMLKVRRLYDVRLRTNPLEDISRIISATSTSVILVICVRTVVGASSGAASQAVRMWVATTVLLALGRVGIAVIARRRQRAGLDQLATLIIGANDVGLQIAHRLADRPELGLRPVGFVDDSSLPRVHLSAVELPILGSTDALEEIVRCHAVRHLIIGFTGSQPPRLAAAVRKCRGMGVQISTVPRLYEEVNRRVEVEHIGGIPLLSSRPIDPRGWQFSLKYALDQLIAAALLIVLAPVMALIAVAVRLSSPGPAFYRQPRVSLDGREFVMLKFRTMIGDATRDGHLDAQWAARTVKTTTNLPRASNGDRSTRVGVFLRRYSLDEMPQLFNVLFGDMSLVGPRPERTSYVRLFSEHIYRYADRHRVKSGLTGWAQVYGLRGETSLADRVEWDNYYIENWSLWLDLKILFLTTPAIFRRRRA